MVLWSEAFPWGVVPVRALYVCTWTGKAGQAGLCSWPGTASSLDSALALGSQIVRQTPRGFPSNWTHEAEERNPPPPLQPAVSWTRGQVSMPVASISIEQRGDANADELQAQMHPGRLGTWARPCCCDRNLIFRSENPKILHERPGCTVPVLQGNGSAASVYRSGVKSRRPW